jgi:hypothetical protein
MFLSFSHFMLFGMGNKRRKFVYTRGGHLLDAWTLETVQKWEVDLEIFKPSEFCVQIFDHKGKEIWIYEDEDTIWLKENQTIKPLTQISRINLPRFHNHPYADWLRVLLSEILVNITPFGPVPNLWVYPRPWYRDASMMLMCLSFTNNLHVVEDWVMGLKKVFDCNNECEEPDNIGQVLYMVSLFEAKTHPIITKALKSISKFRKRDYIVGLTDSSYHPVYQTKWLKFGLKKLELEDNFKIPDIPDSYSSIFWMDFRDKHIPCERFSEESKILYPYLAWAEAHFYNDPFPVSLKEIFVPLTYEAKASQAEYWKLKGLSEAGIISSNDVNNLVSRPHGWHAAEMFLYLYDCKIKE